jgi:hypothetical protein
MRSPERGGDLGAILQRVLELQPLPPDQLVECLAGNKLHSDERLAILLTDFVDRADVGMVQRRGGLCLALETGESLRISGYVVA